MQRMTGNGDMRKIDFVFYHENEIRAAVLDAREGANVQSGRGGGQVGDPTASRALKNMTPLLSVRVRGDKLDWPEHWLKVVDATYAWCDGDRMIVAHDRYHNVSYADTCAKLNITKSGYYRIVKEVRHYAELCAVQLGLIKVC